MDNSLDITTKVKKPVEAIQCANTFSLLQRKMYNVLLANAAGNLYPDRTHSISMKKLCQLMGYRSNDYKTIKEKFRELRRMDIEWDVINEEGNNVWTNTSPLSLARVIEGEGICEYEFTRSLIPYLDRPAQYAKFSLAIQAKFKSSYGLALYENCERYRNMGCTRTFDIATFRKLMGVSETQYVEFFALKRRVIMVAMKEVNQHADFDIDALYDKKGRNIVAIKFVIKSKQIKSSAIKEIIEDQPKGEGSLKENLTQYFSLKEKEIEKIVKKYGKKYVTEKIKVILDSESFKKGQINNMAGYLKKALTEDYQANVSSKTIVQKEKQVRDTQLALKEKQANELRDMKKKHDYYLANEIQKLFPKLGKRIKAKLLTTFEQYLGNSIYLDIFRKEGIANVLVADRFVAFAQMDYPQLFKKMMTLEEYIEKQS